MITVLLSVFCLIAGYLLGSIMSAVKIARSKSTDIHACGSGNAGSTNVLRTFGWKWGLICLASDSAKGAASVGVGYAAAAIAPALFSNYVMPENLSGILGCIGLLGAILGHLLPVFYEFRGGKCVAVALGGLLVLSPVQLLIAVGCAVILIAITKMVSVGSVVGDNRDCPCDLPQPGQYSADAHCCCDCRCCHHCSPSEYQANYGGPRETARKNRMGETAD